ncbi:hypothetical protein [Pectobacterium cacticida]|uniref:hypothetical protein n=1 Tax=Pectobacterium cacticida TaxID=69221 RepID=UPI00398626FB
MTAIQTFDTADWIARNTFRGTRLSREAQEAVSAFTMMWNFFESTLCENRASLAAFDRALENFNAYETADEVKNSINECLYFWRARYITPHGFGERFDGLYFRASDRRQHVERVLNGQLDAPTAQLLALMIIVYRLRNNLFHGLKSIDMLNEQVDNLNIATKCLAAILESLPSRWVRAH